MPKPIKWRKVRKYSDEFKSTAVALTYIESVQVREVADHLDIHPFMLSKWRKEHREGKLVVKKRKKQAVELSKLKKLENENVRLKKELDVLKKWQRYLAETKREDLDSSENTEEL